MNNFQGNHLLFKKLILKKNAQQFYQHFVLFIFTKNLRLLIYSLKDNFFLKYFSLKT